MIERLARLFQDIHHDSSRGFQWFAGVRQGTNLLIGILLAKSSLSLVEIGTYEMWIYLGLFFTFFCISGALQSMAAFYQQVNQNDQHRVLALVFTYILAGSLVLALLLIFGKQFILQVLLHIEDLPHYHLVVGFLFLHLCASMIPFVFLVRNQHNYFVPGSFLYALGYLLAVAIPLMLGNGLTGIIYGLLIFAIAEHALLWYLVCTGSLFPRDRRLWLRFVAIAVPLTIYGGMGVLAQIFDAWLVTWKYDTVSAFAVFKYGARELPGALALAGAFTTAMITVYASRGQSGLARIRQGSERLMHLFFPLSIILVLLSPLIFPLLYNSSFYTSAFIFNTYLLLMISRWVFPHPILIALKGERTLLVTSLIELIVNIVLSLYFVQFWGLVGIAIGTVIAFMLEKVCLILTLQFKYKIRPGAYIPVRQLLFYSICMSLSYWLCYQLYTYEGI